MSKSEGYSHYDDLSGGKVKCRQCSKAAKQAEEACNENYCRITRQTHQFHNRGKIRCNMIEES